MLKSGMLLAAFDERRPTGDVDLLAANISNDAETISRLIREILAIRGVRAKRGWSAVPLIYRSPSSTVSNDPHNRTTAEEGIALALLDWFDAMHKLPRCGKCNQGSPTGT